MEHGIFEIFGTSIFGTYSKSSPKFSEMFPGNRRVGNFVELECAPGMCRYLGYCFNPFVQVVLQLCTYANHN